MKKIIQRDQKKKGKEDSQDVESTISEEEERTQKVEAAEKLQNEDCDTLILSGDVPLITEQTLINLYETHMVS